MPEILAGGEDLAVDIPESGELGRQLLHRTGACLTWKR